MDQLKHINSTSEDESADAGNDYLEIAGFVERLSSDAIAVFGDQVMNFGGDEI
jgi:hypothetical protein